MLAFIHPNSLTISYLVNHWYLTYIYMVVEVSLGCLFISFNVSFGPIFIRPHIRVFSLLIRFYSFVISRASLPGPHEFAGPLAYQ